MSAIMQMEDAAHFLKESQVAEEGRPCMSIMQHSSPRSLLIHNQDKQHVSPSANTSVPSGLTDSRLPDLQRPAALKYPIERYLPPSGPYCDQYTFAAVIYQTFSKNKKWCASCWVPRHEVQSSCTTKCWICATKQHIGKVSARDMSLMVVIGSTDLIPDLPTAILRRKVVTEQKHT